MCIRDSNNYGVQNPIGLMSNSTTIYINSKTVSNYGGFYLIYLSFYQNSSDLIKLHAQVCSFGNDYFGPSGTYLFRSDSINSSTSDLGPITQRRFSRRNPLMVDVGSINNNNYSTSSILDNYHFGNHNAGGFSSHIYGENANDIAIHPSNGLCLLYTSPSPRDRTRSRMPSSA